MATKKCSHQAREHLGSQYYRCFECGKVLDKSNIRKPFPGGQWTPVWDTRIREKGDYYDNSTE